MCLSPCPPQSSLYLEEEVVVVTNTPALLHPGHIGEARAVPGLSGVMPGDLEEQDSLP